MKRKAVGFYWTLPVPWAGFQRLPDDIDAAAAASRTIAYQRALIQRYAQNEGFALIHEAAFIELQPDRGTEMILDDLRKAAAICRAQDATLLYVDFGYIQQWRSHLIMNRAIGDLGVPYLEIQAEPTPVDGQMFDPYAHFQEWRERQRAFSQDKPARAAAAAARALELRAQGARNPEIARRLNAEGLRSPTGKDWSADSLRKFLAASGS